MSKKINLCTPDLFPGMQYVGVKHILYKIGLIVVAVAVISYGINSLIDYQVAKMKQFMINTQEKINRIQMESLLAQEKNIKSLAALKQELSDEMKLFNDKKTELNLLLNKKNEQAKPFLIMSNITKKIPDTVWLNRMEINNNQIILKGKTNTPSDLDNWLMVLTDDNYFKSYDMGDFRIEVENNLDVKDAKDSKKVWDFSLRNIRVVGA